MPNPDAMVPIYQFFSGWMSDIYYSFKEKPADTFNQGQVVFHAFKTPEDGTVPIYEFFNSWNNDHYYSKSNRSPGWGWNACKVAFFAYADQAHGTEPVLEYCNAGAHMHEYTLRETPYDSGWRPQGTAFFAYSPVDEMTGVEFYPDQAKINSQEMHKLGEATNNNTTNTQQKVNLKYYEGVTTTTSWTNTIGFKYSVSTKIDGGAVLPGPGVNIGLEFSHTHSWTDSEAKQKAEEVTVELLAAPGAKVHADAVCTKVDMDLPFRMTFKSGRTFEGVWSGVAHSKVEVRFDESKAT